MKNKGIVIFLILLAAVIVGIMVFDWYSKRPDNMDANKFESVWLSFGMFRRSW